MTNLTDADRASDRLSRNLGARSGTSLGRYELVRRIGSGGMAEVYEAVHRGLKKTVAIKVLLPEVAGNDDLRARFLREGEAASRIQHPHVVDVTDVGEDGGIPYLVMELLVGETLTEVIEGSKRLSVPRSLDILLPIAAALSEAHRRGVVHRDLKPDNIFIARTANGKAVPKLLDFGVSKLTTAGIPSNTAISSVLGTPHYMAPEQALGTAAVDARADQYTFALVVYECITGELPFSSENVVALLHEVSRGVQTPPSAYVLDLPASLDTILLRALSPNPSDRYADLAELTSYLLPFATPRAARDYRVLANQDSGEWRPGEERPAASEITGDFTYQSTKRRRVVDAAAVTDYPPAPSPAGTPTPTVVNRNPLGSLAPPTEGVTFLPPEQQNSRASRLVLLGLVLAVALGVGGWALFARSPENGPSAPPRGAVLAATGVQAVPPGAGAATTGAQLPPVQPGSPSAVVSPSLTRIVVVAFPSDATLELDGVTVGQGSLDHALVLDGRLHTLVVAAPGYESERLTFTTQAPPARVELSRARRHASTMGGANASPANDPPPRRPADNDLRDSR
ncbi:MAG: serine/threonine protein kinase [Sandaracinaceae bacterium]|nr:serine/threonine protein kinase [Sandaracinaceae bacterium]